MKDLNELSDEDMVAIQRQNLLNPNSPNPSVETLQIVARGLEISFEEYQLLKFHLLKLEMVLGLVAVEAHSAPHS